MPVIEDNTEQTLDAYDYASIKRAIAAENWETDANNRMSNQIIAAYLQGKEDGFNHAQATNNKLILDQAIRNIGNSSRHVLELIRIFKVHHLTPQTILLKMASWNDFKILIVLSVEDFVSENLLTVYDHITAIEKDTATDLYQIEILVIAASEHFDIDCVEADGFIFRYKL